MFGNDLEHTEEAEYDMLSQAEDFFYGSADEGVSYGAVPVRPERNLLAAILGRAICDAFGQAQCDAHVVRNARNWLFSKLTPTKPYSFAWIAVQLELSPIDLQNKLKNETVETMVDRLTVLRG